MPKHVNNAVLDAALDTIINNADLLIAFSTYSTDYDTIYANRLATAPLTSGSFTKASGDVSGRKLTIAQQTGITVANNGTYNYMAVVKQSTKTVYLVTDGNAKVLNQDDPLTISAFKYEIGAPA